MLTHQAAARVLRASHLLLMVVNVYYTKNSSYRDDSLGRRDMSPIEAH
jgi:hypothetical protein